MLAEVSRVKADRRLHSGWIIPYLATPMALVLFWWLGHVHLLAATPYWILVALLVNSGVCNAAALIGTRSSNQPVRINVRAAVSAATTTSVIYATGWGPLIAIGYTLGVADVITSEDADAWVPATLWTDAGLFVGELLVQLHHAPTMVSVGVSHSIALGNLICGSILLRLFAGAWRVAKDARDEISLREERFRSLVQHAADVIAVLALDGTIEYVSPAVTDMLGFTPEQCEGSHIGMLLQDDERAANMRELAVVIGPTVGVPVSFETVLPHRNGTRRIAEVTLTRLANDHVAANLHDLTDRRALENELRRQAHTDTLTSLPNRAAITTRLEAAVATRSTTVLFIDLDGFKAVNDRLGHERGDAVLVEAARRIAAILDLWGTVGRLGGDEFLAVLPEMELGEAVDIAERILEALTAPWPDGVAITASIGIATSHPDEAAEHILHRADHAMYEAKENGRARCRIAA